MGFFSPGFIIGAASSLSGQIDDAKERNAAEMERRRNQFDILSRETKRELRKKRQTQEEQAKAISTLLSGTKDGQVILTAIGEDTTALSGLYQDFATRQQQDRNFTIGNFSKSVYRNGMTEEGKFDPSRVVEVRQPAPMDDLEQTDESFIGRFGRALTGAPSQQELAETDVSRLSSDIPEAEVKLSKIYNPVAPDSREWTNYEKLFAESENLTAVIDPFDRTVDRQKTFANAEEDIRQKFNILNELRMGQAYTAEDLPGILNDIKTIYGKIKELPKDQADAVVAEIASDMNRTSVPEVMKKLDRYVPKAETGQTPEGAASATEQPAPTESGIDEGLRRAITEQIKSGNAPNIQTDDSKPPVYEIEYNGEIYQIEMVEPGQPRILKTEG